MPVTRLELFIVRNRKVNKYGKSDKISGFRAPKNYTAM